MVQNPRLEVNKNLPVTSLLSPPRPIVATITVAMPSTPRSASPALVATATCAKPTSRRQTLDATLGTH